MILRASAGEPRLIDDAVCVLSSDLSSALLRRSSRGGSDTARCCGYPPQRTMVRLSCIEV